MFNEERNAFQDVLAGPKAGTLAPGRCEKTKARLRRLKRLVYWRIPHEAPWATWGMFSEATSRSESSRLQFKQPEEKKKIPLLGWAPAWRFPILKSCELLEGASCRPNWWERQIKCSGNRRARWLERATAPLDRLLVPSVTVESRQLVPMKRTNRTAKCPSEWDPSLDLGLCLFSQTIWLVKQAVFWFPTSLL